MASEKQSKLANIGMILGMIAFSMALMHFWLGPIGKPPPLEEVVAEKAKRIKEALKAGFAGSDVEDLKPRSAWDPDRMVQFTATAMGLGALILAAFSFVQREDKRVSAMAATFGFAAIAFQFLVAAIAAIVIAILIAAVLSGGG